MTQYISKSGEETFALGSRMAADAKPGDVVALCGDLGAGKTVFAKGFAAGLGVQEAITSPTFTIVCEYDEGRLPLYHFDVYRIEDAEELFEIGLEEYLFGDGVCLIEWADKIWEELPAQMTVITIKNRDDGVREIDITAKGEKP